MSQARYKVRVTKDYLVFSSGHFITYAGGLCEPVHGHNYRVAVEVEGDLDGNAYVFDFITLKDLTLEIVAELDHRMLLPTGSDLIRIEDDGPNWRARYKERWWSFPKDECALLPVPNTTAELVANYIATRLLADIAAQGGPAPRVLRVELEENFGQSAQVERAG